MRLCSVEGLKFNVLNPPLLSQNFNELLALRECYYSNQQFFMLVVLRVKFLHIYGGIFFDIWIQRAPEIN